MADFLTRRIFPVSFVALVLIVHPVLLSAQIPGPTAVSPAITTEGDQALDIAKRARALASTGQYAPAIALGERALVMARAQYGPRHEYVAYILDDLAT
jgi:hypothetical protein